MKLEQKNAAQAENFSICDRHPSALGSEGTTENSPAVHCRVEDRIGLSSEGTAEFNRPFGTHVITNRFPALKRRAIVGSPFGTYARAGLKSTPE